MIGDQVHDLRAAWAAGATPVLVRAGKAAETQAHGIPEDILPVSIYASSSGAVEVPFPAGP